MKMQALALAFLAATAIGGLAWVFIYPLLSGERKAENSPCLDREAGAGARARSTKTSARAANRSKDR